MKLHHVFANRSNVGDWLSARGIQSLLSPHTFEEHLCDEPFVEETLARLSELTAADFVVIGGGGLFMDYFAPFWEGFRPIAERVPFAIWGVGHCDMKREMSRAPTALLEAIVCRSRLCIVRDELTRHYLSGCGLPPAIPCPAIACIKPRPLGKGVLHIDAYDNVGHDNYAYMEAMGAEHATRTGRRFASINNLIPSGSTESLANALDQYAQSDLILAGRLHGCIIGLAMGRKVLAVSGDWKVESFMQAAGLGEWVLDLKQLEQVPERLRELPGQEPPLGFLKRARAENHALGKRIKEIMK